MRSSFNLFIVFPINILNMKLNILFGFIILFVFINSSVAQIRVGILGGINSTGFSGDNPPNGNFASDMGYSAGATADFFLVDDIVVNIQALYSYRSTKIQYDVSYQYDMYDSLAINTYYFELPVNVKVFSNNRMSFVTAGLCLAIPLSSIILNNRLDTEQDIKDRFEPYVLNANFGIGLQFRIGKPMIFTELRYSQSLTNLTNIKMNDIAINNKLKSNSIQIYIGMLFTF